MKIYNILNGLMQIIITLPILIGVAACNDNIIEGTSAPEIMGDSFTITGSLAIPEMISLTTREGSEETPDNELKLTVFEFDLVEGQPEMTFLSNIYNAEIIDRNIGKFKLTLKSSEKKKVLHFMLASESLTSQFGSEAEILQKLAVTGDLAEDEDDDAGEMGGGDDAEEMVGGNDAGGIGNGAGIGQTIDGRAYWGRVELPYLKEGIEDKLNHIPVIRNFAQISVTVAENVDNFDLWGFDIVNVPTSGTIAPWDRDEQKIPVLLDKDNEMLAYTEINYKGIIPPRAQFRNTENEAKNWDQSHRWFTFDESCFLYEHPYESTRRSYIIIIGIFDDTDICYYKLDIGTTVPHDPNDPVGNLDPTIFKQYNIIRNINYKITINSVAGVGALSVEEAINGAPYNNISAAIETAPMLNISNGTNQLFVNATNHIIITDAQPIEILYRYRKNINTSTPENDNSPAFPIGLKDGPVIKEFKEKDQDGNYLTVIQNNVEWRKIEIIPNPPTDIVKKQSFSIVDADGLGRTINLTLRTPWKYEPIVDPETGSKYNATVKNGDKNYYEVDNPAPDDISPYSGRPLTVYFNLPDGLDETMFPLQFQLESKYQWMENNKIGNLVVTTGPSLFDSSVTAISYIKTVSYQEYLYKYADDSNELDVNASNVNHTIRCRFLTISNVENGSDAVIRIYNPYFLPNDVEYDEDDPQRSKCAEVSFIRTDLL